MECDQFEAKVLIPPNRTLETPQRVIPADGMETPESTKTPPRDGTETPNGDFQSETEGEKEPTRTSTQTGLPPRRTGWERSRYLREPDHPPPRRCCGEPYQRSLEVIIFSFCQ